MQVWVLPINRSLEEYEVSELVDKLRTGGGIAREEEATVTAGGGGGEAVVVVVVLVVVMMMTIIIYLIFINTLTNPPPISFSPSCPVPLSPNNSDAIILERLAVEGV
jgi:hypothetical protein